MYVVRKMHAGLPKRRGNPKDDFRNAQLYKNKIEKLKPIIMQQYEYTNKIYYDHFVLPFTIGLVVLLGYLCVKYYKWIKSFPKEERKKRLVQFQDHSFRLGNLPGKLVAS